MSAADPLYCISLADLVFTQNCQGKSHLEEISGKPKLIFLVKNVDILKTIKNDWVLDITTPEYDMPACPAPPTDLVFASDFHTEVTPQIFERTREIITVMVNVTKIRDNDFSAGARVTVVSYTLAVHNLVCFSESCNKNKHLRGCKNLNYQRSSSGCNIGNALRLLPETFFK